MVATVGTTCITAEAPTEGIIEVRNADFPTGASALKCLLKGNGSVTLRLDDKDAADLATISSTGDGWQTLHTPLSSLLSGTHTLYFILKGDVQFDTWQFVSGSTDGIGIAENRKSANGHSYDILGRRISPAAYNGICIVDGKKYLTK